MSTFYTSEKPEKSFSHADNHPATKPAENPGESALQKEQHNTADI